jgi:hypothetical protein
LLYGVFAEEVMPWAKKSQTTMRASRPTGKPEKII